MCRVARIQAHYPGGGEILQQAQLGWQFLMRRWPDTAKPAPTRKSLSTRSLHPRRRTAWAACEMYLATATTSIGRNCSRGSQSADYQTFAGAGGACRVLGNAIPQLCVRRRSGRLPASVLDARYLRICEGEILAAAMPPRWSNKNATRHLPTATKVVRGAGWYFLARPGLRPGHRLPGRAQNGLPRCPRRRHELRGRLQSRQRRLPHGLGTGASADRQPVRPERPPHPSALGPSARQSQTAFQYLPYYGSELREALIRRQRNHWLVSFLRSLERRVPM